jgi:hypothetical protein
MFPALADPYNTARTLPLWFTLLGGRLFRRCAFAITLADIRGTHVDGGYPREERFVGKVGTGFRSQRCHVRTFISETFRTMFVKRGPIENRRCQAVPFLAP